MGDTETKLTVEYVHERPGEHTGNILWKPSHPMRGGKFPATHPAAPGFKFGIRDQMGDSDKMIAFRSRGYWASCFPEGDGITMKCSNGQTPEQVVKDIEEVFGWRVKVRGGR